MLAAEWADLSGPAGRWLTCFVIAGCVALAVSNAFVLDDAFISFRYARNLVETGELTWNPGEPVWRWAALSMR